MEMINIFESFYNILLPPGRGLPLYTVLCELVALHLAN